MTLAVSDDEELSVLVLLAVVDALREFDVEPVTEREADGEGVGVGVLDAVELPVLVGVEELVREYVEEADSVCVAVLVMVADPVGVPVCVGLDVPV